VAFGSSTECENSTYHTPLTATPATEITLEAEYGPECHTSSGLPETVTMNGCDYRLHNLKKVASGHYNATVDIVCPEGKVIELHVYATHTAHTEKKSLCTKTIPAQTNLEKLTITTKTTSGSNFGDLVIEGTIANVHAIQHRNSILCPAGTETNTAEEVISGGTLTGGVNDIEISGE